MATKSISQLDTQATANETDLFEVAIVDANSASGYASKKESAAAIADAIVGEYQYPLRITGTTAKTISGAINEIAGEVADLKDLEGSASGDIATFVDGSDNPLRELKISIVAQQSGSGDPSPTNVRPISGWTGANISRTRKNIFDYNAIESISIGISIRNGINFYKTGVYSISAQNNTGYCYCRVFNADGTIKDTHYIVAETIITPITISIVSGEYFAVYDAVGSATIAQSKIAFERWQIQVEMSDSPTAYEPYNGNTYNISWQDEAGTVYGGELNVKTGVLTVTYANIASYDGETINEPWISSMDVYSAGATPTTGAQVIYPLTTPVTYQLTPTEIRSLLGVNNIWANCGSVIELKYIRDLNLCINDIIARIEALEGGSSTRSLSVSPVLTKSIVSDSDTAEGKTEETEEETKEEAQNER